MTFALLPVQSPGCGAADRLGRRLPSCALTAHKPLPTLVVLFVKDACVFFLYLFYV